MVHDGQEIIMSFVNSPADAGILIEGVLDGRLDVAENDDRRLHIDSINRLFPRRSNVDKALTAQSVDDGRFIAGRIDGMVDGISEVAGNKFRQDFRDDDLADVGNAGHIIGIEKTDAGNAAIGSVADMGSNGRIVEFSQQITGADAVDSGIGNHLPFLAGIVDIQGPDVILFDVAVNGFRMVPFIPESAANGPQAFGTTRLERADADFPRF